MHSERDAAEAWNRRAPSTEAEDSKEPFVITIKWRDGAYYVDKPNFGTAEGTAMVPYADYLAQVDRLTAVTKHLSDQCDAAAKWEDECERLKGELWQNREVIRPYGDDAYALSVGFDALKAQIDELRGELASAKEDNSEACCFVPKLAREGKHLREQLAASEAARGTLKDALEGWQHTWEQTDCEYDDCRASAEAAHAALAFTPADAMQEWVPRTELLRNNSEWEKQHEALQEELERVTKERDEAQQLLSAILDADVVGPALDNARAALARQGGQGS